MSEEPLSPPPGLTEMATFLASKVGLVGRRVVADALEASGMKVSHYAVLACLDAYGPSAQRELAGRLALDASDVVAIVDELEEAGRVERRRDPADRRRHAVTATAAGRAAYVRAHAAALAAQDEFLAPLGESERRELRTLLHSVLAAHDPRFAAPSGDR